MLRKYLQLARLPNAFTAPTNIIAGYFILTPVTSLNYLDLVMLMISSMLFYVSGVIFNDYFDIEIDRKERPSRPLPSGAVSRQSALRIALVLMGLAMTFDFFVSWQSFAVAVFLAGMILAYDYRLKRNKILNPVTMGGSRFLNVILGASPAIQLPLETNFWHLILIACFIFAYVAVIALFSSKELSGIKSKRQIALLFSIDYGIIASIGTAIFLGILKPSSFIILASFAVIISLIFRQTLLGNAVTVQNTIKNLVISIIVLDCVFVSGTAGFAYGLPTLLFLLPSVILSKKFYVT